MRSFFASIHRRRPHAAQPPLAGWRTLLIAILFLIPALLPRRRLEDEETDCAIRFFHPAAGVPEDPVTGSIHTSLVPYGAGRLGRPTIYACQLSPHGELFCEDRGDRVIIAGYAVTHMTGAILLPD